MQQKNITFSEDARSAMFKGVEKLAKAVSATMGPKGRNAVLEKEYGSPVITNDGVTIAREIVLEDRLENLGAQIVKEAATQTNDLAGDGTTTATLLAYTMIKEGLKNLTAGANPMMMKPGIEKAVQAVVDHLDTQKKTITTKEEVAQVATISAQNEEVGQLIADIIETVGKEGVITVEESQTIGLQKKIVDGMELDNGYISPYMITDPARMEARYEQPHILIVDQKLNNIQELLPLLEQLAQTGQKELVIIAEDVDGDVLSTLIVNKMRGTFNTVAVRCPGYGDRRKEIMKDIAAATGATLISADVGLQLKTATVDMLGSARKVIVTKDSTTILEGKGNPDAITTRKELIRAQLQDTQSDFDIQQLNARLAKLSGGVGVILVGAATEVELQEKKHRIEDALSATRAAVDEGIVAGGGTALAKATNALESLVGANADEQTGINLVRKALLAPVIQIAQNAGKEGNLVAEKVVADTEHTKGYNAVTEQIEDLFEAGIIDPKKVTRVALQNAASVAAMFLTTESAITNIPKKESSPLPQGY